MTQDISHGKSAGSHSETRWLRLDIAVTMQAVVRLVRLAGAVLVEWLERYRQRRALARLDDRLLRDIGMTREQARRETRKPFWSP
jgi:uncharacterized protein YjiS (DUF1127 family)